MERQPYSGTRRKLVLAFDIGTTYSGISYSILDPGVVPKIQGVNQFTGQEKVGGDAKVPTVIHYDNQGNVKAVGADPIDEDWAGDDSEDWIKAEWFKLHMRPATSQNKDVNETIPPLPPNKTVIDLFSDFMRYLFQQAKKYITEHNPNGDNYWRTLEDDIDYVITHPNGWEGAQQAMMRQALVKAGLISDADEAHKRVQFLSEGEASLNFCILNGLSSDMHNSGVIVLDLGGGTVDLSCYTSTGPQTFAEIARPLCTFNGSIFITRQARRYLEVHLQGSRYAGDIDHMVKIFDQNTKLSCRNATDAVYLKFGTLRDRDLSRDIRSGQMKLAGAVIASFFEPSVEAIVSSIKTQMSLATVPISSVYVVGGFGASEYVFSRLQATMAPLGIKICRPDSFLNKAVAEGAVSFYLDHFVSSRVSSMTFGTQCSSRYNEMDMTHVTRSDTAYVDISGEKMIPKVFDIILSKDVQVAETKEFRKHYYRKALDRDHLNQVSEPVMSYRGDMKDPRWVDIDEDNFTTLCRVEADTTSICKKLQKVPAQRKKKAYFKLEYDIILSFGLTELKAQVAWQDNGLEKRGPARIIYD